LTSALELAKDLDATFQIVVTRVVPFPLPLDQPPIPRTFTEQQILELTKEIPVKAAVRIYDCRDPETTLLQVLPPASIVIAGFRGSWWPSPENKLARKLRKGGHDVVLT
jgi:hypothetical protein